MTLHCASTQLDYVFCYCFGVAFIYPASQLILNHSRWFAYIKYHVISSIAFIFHNISGFGFSTAELNQLLIKSTLNRTFFIKVVGRFNITAFIRVEEKLVFTTIVHFYRAQISKHR